ncbi:hypothetical protein D9M70_572380 [compost metagenome]
MRNGSLKSDRGAKSEFKAGEAKRLKYIFDATQPLVASCYRTRMSRHLQDFARFSN